MTLKKLLTINYDLTNEEITKLSSYIENHNDLNDVVYTYELYDMINEAMIELEINC